MIKVRGGSFLFGLNLVIMSIFIWNCQGVGSLPFIKSFKLVLKQYRTELVVIMKIHISGVKSRESDKEIQEIRLCTLS